MSQAESVLRDRYVASLKASGALSDPLWIGSFRAIPRQLFVPQFFTQTETGAWELIDATNRHWLESVYADGTLTTQLDPDSAESPFTAPTSSSSQPSLMAEMLQALDLSDGHRVLEIGTGTGYNAALLCHRLGDEAVTSIDIDADLARAATARLATLGYHPRIVTGDGDHGHPADAPYDRIIATCSVPHIPAPWIAQTRPGGHILTSLYRDLGGGPLIRLTVTATGTAEGRFLPTYGGFMPIRARHVLNAQRLLAAALHGRGESTTWHTGLPAGILDHPDFSLYAALAVPATTWIGFEPDTGYQLWLLHKTGSWAYLDTTTATVHQHGPHQLWTSLETAHQNWQRAGSPARDRLGLTVTANGEHTIWLDNPAVPLPRQQTGPTPR